MQYEGRRKFALIAQDTFFGQRLLAHANQRLADFGLQPEALLVLSDEDLADENNLKAAIRNFTRYVPPVEGETIGESPFDALVFAGDPKFALGRPLCLLIMMLAQIGCFIWETPYGIKLSYWLNLTARRTLLQGVPATLI